MAVVYLDFDALEQFQDELGTISDNIADQAFREDELIQTTKKRIQAFIDSAESKARHATAELKLAEGIASEHERWTFQTPDDYFFSPYDAASLVSDGYSAALVKAQSEYDLAKRQVEKGYAAEEDYRSFCESYREKQSQALENFNALLKKSKDFVENYINILEKSKHANLYSESPNPAPLPPIPDPKDVRNEDVRNEIFKLIEKLPDKYRNLISYPYLKTHFETFKNPWEKLDYLIKNNEKKPDDERRYYSSDSIWGAHKSKAFREAILFFGAKINSIIRPSNSLLSEFKLIEYVMPVLDAKKNPIGGFKSKLNYKTI